MRLRVLWLVSMALAVAGGASGWAGGPAQAAEEAPDPLGYVIDPEALDDPAAIADGRELYRTGCVSCHGVEGVGAAGGPAIVDAGAASAHFYLTTGRMPHAGGPDVQAVRKDPAYSPEEIEDLVAYVASLGEGPEIPHVDLSEGSVQEGGDLFRGICAACHSASGAGGALSFGQNAPSLDQATPVQVYEAMLVGPGQMPVFGPPSYSEEQLNSIVAYVETLQELDDPGGFSLGRVGPIPEGFVAVIIGTGATVLAAFLIGRRVHDDHDVDQDVVSSSPEVGQ